jgi:hypothetical protein
MTFQLQNDKNSFQFHIICIGMNPLKHDAPTRTKNEIEAIRHVYIDLYYGGEKALAGIQKSSVVPKANFVLTSSPEKFQIVWQVDGLALEEAEALLHALAREFGGDPQADGYKCVLGCAYPHDPMHPRCNT